MNPFHALAIDALNKMIRQDIEDDRANLTLIQTYLNGKHPQAIPDSDEPRRDCGHQ